MPYDRQLSSGVRGVGRVPAKAAAYSTAPTSTSVAGTAQRARPAISAMGGLTSSISIMATGTSMNPAITVTV